MKDMLGGSYWQAVRGTWRAEWLSMNAVMAGMVPVMIVLMARDMRAMEPINPRFWGIMSLATLVGAVLAFPINWWLVKNGLKHGMGTERALGRGGSLVELEREHLAATASIEPIGPSVSGPDRLGPAHNRSRMGVAGRHGAALVQAGTGATHHAGADALSMGGMKMKSDVSMKGKVAVAMITVVMLVAGVAVAARYGDFSMRTGGHAMKEPMTGHDGMTK